MSLLLINGVAPSDPSHAIAANDRGLQYGDGLFETILLKNSLARHLDDHLARLKLGCTRLGIQYPGDEILRLDIAQLTQAQSDGVLKIVVTRGTGGRGYRPDNSMQPTRIVGLHPLPPPLGESIAVKWCATRLGHNPALAGLKHLNRLEQVLAQMEWQPAQFGEGLMMDIQGNVVCGTSTNLFAVIDGVLCTPEIVNCGIRGVMRGQVLKVAAKLGIQTEEGVLQPAALARATEVFLTNAVRGIVAVAALEQRRWDIGPIIKRIAETLSAS